MLLRFAELVDAVNERIGRAVAWLTLAMVLLMFSEVVARYAFAAASQGVADGVTRMHALVFMLGLAYTLKHDAHVRVDLFSRHWSERRRAAVELACTFLLLLPFCALLTFGSIDYVAVSWRIGEGSEAAGGLPGVYLLKTAIPVAAALLALQGLARAARALHLLRRA